MARVTTDETLSESAWTQIATDSQRYFLTVLSGAVWLRYSATNPGANVNTGHKLQAGDTFGDDAGPAWLRAVNQFPSDIATKIAITKN